MIPANVILIWASTNASIPAGWARETALDGKFPKGTSDSVDPGNTGGSATHAHTSPIHTHSMIAHTHTFDTSNFNTPSGLNTGGTNNGLASDAAHTHNGNTSGSSVGGDLSDAITYVSVNSEPPHRKVIFIKPSGVVGVPTAGIIGFWQGTAEPSQWKFCDGANSTPDFRNRYLKGALTGDDADLSDLGSLTHIHDVSHQHSSQNHTHTGTTTAGNTQNRHVGGTQPSTFSTHQHTHTYSLANSGETGNTYSGSVTSDTVEPLYKKLSAIMAQSGYTPKNLIGLWLGALSDIPLGWKLCDGNNGTPDMRDYHLKLSNTLDEANNTGGANTHSHASSNSHTHSALGSHNHSGSTTNYDTSLSGRDGSGDNIIYSHYHSITNVQSQTSTFNTATISGNSANNEPAYKTVAFIQLQHIDSGGMMALLV